MPDFEEVFTINTPQLKVWDFMTDVKKVGQLIPGCKKVDVVDDKTAIITVQAKVGLISAHFKIKTVIRDQDPPHSVNAVCKGEDSRLASFIDLKSSLSLEPVSENVTRVTFKSRAVVSGRLGSLGWGVMMKKAEQMSKKFVIGLKQKLEQSTKAGAGRG